MLNTWRLLDGENTSHNNPTRLCSLLESYPFNLTGDPILYAAHKATPVWSDERDTNSSLLSRDYQGSLSHLYEMSPKFLPSPLFRSPVWETAVTRPIRVSHVEAVQSSARLCPRVLMIPWSVYVTWWTLRFPINNCTSMKHHTELLPAQMSEVEIPQINPVPFLTPLVVGFIICLV